MKSGYPQYFPINTWSSFEVSVFLFFLLFNKSTKGNFMNAHSYEIYMDDGTRQTVAPKDQMGFVDAVVHSNKRIHCQVEEYNQTHRKWEKKRRKEEKKAKRTAAQ